MKTEECYYEGCNEVAVVKDLCLKHYNLWLGNVDGRYEHIRSVEQRFWSRVWKPTKDGCWIWKGTIMGLGYGSLHINRGDAHRIEMRAHRLSWKIHYGEVPDDLLVLHKCDVRNCVNPRHLFLGTYQDNQSDMVEKGRSAHGEGHSNVKLTEDEVLEIRYLAKTDQCTQKMLAKMFNIGQRMISHIINYDHWNYPEILRREKNYA